MASCDVSINALRACRADLHIHTCLSPCGDWDMTPQKIISKAREKKLSIIAICDHNTSKNTTPVIEAGKKQGIMVLPGMEICTREEVHVLGIFSTSKQASEMEKIVFEHLHGENDPDIFGYQVISDENDFVLGQEKKRLIGATTIPLKKSIELIHNFGGLAIAAHIDRPSFSILSQLGFIPPDLRLDGVEWSAKINHSSKHYFLDKISIPCIMSSDAHFINDIGREFTVFYLSALSFNGIHEALVAGRFDLRR